MKLRLAPWMVLLTLVSSCPVIAAASGVDKEIEDCIRKNAPQSTAIQHIRLSSMDDMFEEKILDATVYWKQLPDGNSDLLAVFEEPSDISGSRLLFLEKKPDKEIYLYMPAFFKVRRITSSRIASSMYGMDFSYEDFQWLYNMLATATSEQRPDAILDGEPVYVLAVVPVDASGSKYEEVVSYFEKKSCVIRKVEFYEDGRKLRKILSAAPGAVKQVSGMLIPHVFQMKDLKKKSETELVITSVRLDPVIPDSIFDPAQLKEPHGIE
ncbi:outer membrane lipoprotein-sorting protein [Pseudomonadota bacterium]